MQLISKQCSNSLIAESSMILIICPYLEAITKNSEIQYASIPMLLNMFYALISND